MNVILIGMKGVGKSRIGFDLAEKCQMNFLDLDRLMEHHYETRGKMRLACREIYNVEGREYFRSLESETLLSVKLTSSVLATGGGTPLSEENQATLKSLGTIVYLDEEFDTLLERILKKGVPAYIKDKNKAREELAKRYEKRAIVYKQIADYTITCNGRRPDEVVNEIIKMLDIYDTN